VIQLQAAATKVEKKARHNSIEEWGYQSVSYTSQCRCKKDLSCRIAKRAFWLQFSFYLSSLT